MSDTAPGAEPPFLFDDSRRLTGPNRHFDRAAVVLTALGAAADDAGAHRCWAALVIAVCAALHWPDPQPQDNPGRLERWTHLGAPVLID